MTRFDDRRIEQLRIPPQSIEAEQAVLGGCMLAPDAFDRIADKLSAEDFYRRDHQMIFRAMVEMSEAEIPFDYLTIGEWFTAQGMAEQVGGGAYLVELATTTPSAANILAYAEIVRDKALLRKIIDIGTGIVNDAFQPDGRDAEEILASAQQSVGDIGIEQDSGGLRMLSATAKSFWRDLAEESQRTGLRPQSTPLHGVNEILMPFDDEAVVTLAGCTSTGKTTMALLIAEHYAVNRGEYVAVFSLEMSPKQLVMRMAAKRARVDGRKLLAPETLDDTEWAALSAAVKEISRWRIAIDDSAGIGLRELRARARRMKKAKGKLGLVVIDYVQLMETPRKDTREQGISAVTRGIKRLSKELKTPVLMLSQLSRKADERGYPVLADLRESGSIEQDSDTVMFLHHKNGHVVFSLPKQRNGERNVSRKIVPEFKHFDFRDFDPLADAEPESDQPAPRAQGFRKPRKPKETKSARDAAAGDA